MLDDNILLNKYFFLNNYYLSIYLNNFHNNKKYNLDRNNCYLYEDISDNNYFINKYKCHNYDYIRKILYVNKILKNHHNFIKISCIYTYSQVKQNVYKHLYKSYPHIKNTDMTIYYLMEINKLSNLYHLDNYHKFYDINDIKLILSQLLLYQLHIFNNHSIIINSIKLNNIFINKQEYTLLKYNILDTEYQISTKYIYQINDYSKSIIYNNKSFHNKFNYDYHLLYNIYKTFIIMFNLFKNDNELEYYKMIINKTDFNMCPLYSYITCDMFCKKFLKLYYLNKLDYNDFIKKTLNIVINYINVIWTDLFNYNLLN